MVNADVAFQAERRSAAKKSDISQIRNEGFIPAIVYSKGDDGTPVKLNEHDFEMMLTHHSGENLMIELQIGGKEARHVLIKEIQHHPLTRRILHVDFHEISLDRMIRVDIPLEIEGKPVGVTQGGGTLDIHCREIEVECKASDLIDNFTIDVSELKIGDSLYVSDVEIPADFELLTEKETSVATVLKPRVIEEDEEDGEETDAAGEPEVITGADDSDSEESEEGESD